MCYSFYFISYFSSNIFEVELYEKFIKCYFKRFFYSEACYNGLSVYAAHICAYAVVSHSPLINSS